MPTGGSAMQKGLGRSSRGQMVARITVYVALATLTAAATVTFADTAAEARWDRSQRAQVLPRNNQSGSESLARYFPNVVLYTQDGNRVRFYDDLIKGKIVLVN